MNITPLISITNEDCMDLMARTPDKYYDLAIVDPPYFNGPNKLGYFGEGYSSIGVTRDKYEKTDDWDIPRKEYFDELFRVSKEQIIWGCNYFPDLNAGPGRIIWDKVNDKSTFSDAEIAYCSLHDSVRLFRFMWNGMNQGIDFTGKMQGNKKMNEKRIHPTQKPVAIYKWQLQKYVKDGFKILDTHSGSGSLAIACFDYGMELDACEKNSMHWKNSIIRVKQHVKNSMKSPKLLF